MGLEAQLVWSQELITFPRPELYDFSPYFSAYLLPISYYPPLYAYVFLFSHQHPS
jgi:hypothetical protein